MLPLAHSYSASHMPETMPRLTNYVATMTVAAECSLGLLLGERRPRKESWVLALVLFWRRTV